jgi:hypothetical protein
MKLFKRALFVIATISALAVLNVAVATESKVVLKEKKGDKGFLCLILPRACNINVQGGGGGGKEPPG